MIAGLKPHQRWNDKDRVHRLITQKIPAWVAADDGYANARIEHYRALDRVMTADLCTPS